MRVFPAPQQPKTVYGLPIKLEAALNSAERCFVDKNWPAAGMAYRRVAERAVKTLYPEGKGMLNARIRKVEEAQSLPHALIELLDQIKLFGNDAAHEDVDPLEDDIIDARTFIHLFLEYTFALPKRVDEAKSRREDRRSEN